MTDIAIQVENLSKQYHIGRAQQRSNTLRDSLVAGLQGAGQRLSSIVHRPSSDGDMRRPMDDTIWALKDVSFDVGHGEGMGIIGRNGAGKSTLLKILSRITEPTEGRAEICGRVGSLLEVGTGFHPELTGRENIYLNGAVLGMRKAEIERGFDEIVAFAEIEQFLDTPVKRYSSGMYVRLAFAVAAHLEPDILIVDEVLAVGDVAFQKKCLGKMQDVAQGGRTVLFVSHNMDAILRFCPRSMLLDRGRVRALGDSADIISRYLSSGTGTAPPATRIDLSMAPRKGSCRAHFVAVSYGSIDHVLGGQAYSEGPLDVMLVINSDAPRVVRSLAVTIYDQTGIKLANADTIAHDWPIQLVQGRNLARMRIRQLHLNPGLYSLGLWLANPPEEIFDQVQSAARIEVVEPENSAGLARPMSDGIVTCQFDLIDPIKAGIHDE